MRVDNLEFVPLEDTIQIKKENTKPLDILTFSTTTKYYSNNGVKETLRKKLTSYIDTLTLVREQFNHKNGLELFNRFLDKELLVPSLVRAQLDYSKECVDIRNGVIVFRHKEYI